LKEYGRPVRVAFEATSNYHRALAYHLAAAGFEVKLVSSVALARTREALNNSWDKNDPKDAQVILYMMEIGNEQFYHDPLVNGTNDIQDVSKTHDIISKSKTELWHRVLTVNGRVKVGQRAAQNVATLGLGPIVSGISSSAISPKTATTPICAERRIPQSPPRWPVLFTGSLNMVSHIAPSLRGDRSQKDLSLYGPRRQASDLVDNV
jgi:hypothetical protein